jgi:HAD superfamily hydrolase (TIGR01662 family)
MDYVLNWDEFLFYDDVIDAIRLFSKTFGHIFIVSNQRGVGRGRMSEKDLHAIHTGMKKEIRNGGGRLDGIYYCTAVDDKDPERKPNPGMALQVKRDFPQVDFSKSIMVGNKLSDMKFGKNAGMYTVYLTTTHPDQPLPHPDIDLSFDTLLSLARFLDGEIKV